MAESSIREMKCVNVQIDDELLARKLQEEESAGLRKNTRRPSKRPVCDVYTLPDCLYTYSDLHISYNILLTITFIEM